MAKKQLIKITESDLSHMVLESIRMIKESLYEMPAVPSSQVVDKYGLFAKLQKFIQNMNEKRDATVRDYGDSVTCLDKEGNFYALTGPIQLSKNGTVIIPSEYGTGKYHALTKAGGIWKKCKGNQIDDGFSLCLKELKRVNNDIDRYIYDIQNYNPDWDEPENMNDQAKADFKQYKKNMPR